MLFVKKVSIIWVFHCDRSPKILKISNFSLNFHNFIINRENLVKIGEQEARHQIGRVGISATVCQVFCKCCSLKYMYYRFHAFWNLRYFIFTTFVANHCLRNLHSKGALTCSITCNFCGKIKTDVPVNYLN